MERTEIIKDLQELADEKYKNFHKSLCPGTENILGIRVPILRNYAKKICKENDYKELLDILQDEFSVYSSFLRRQRQNEQAAHHAAPLSLRILRRQIYLAGGKNRQNQGFVL